MRTSNISVAAARRNFARVLSQPARTGRRIKVRRYGATLAGIVSPADLERLARCDELLARRATERRRPPRATARDEQRGSGRPQRRTRTRRGH